MRVMDRLRNIFLRLYKPDASEKDIQLSIANLCEISFCEKLPQAQEVGIFLLKNHFLEKYKHNEPLCQNILTILQEAMSNEITVVHFC